MCLMNEFVERSRTTAQLYRITFQSGGVGQTDTESAGNARSILSYHPQDAANMNEI